jgi:hypothetical protein
MDRLVVTEGTPFLVEDASALHGTELGAFPRSIG